MPVTLKQIAQEVGVSHPIVSYALNGKSGVGAELRSKIIETAERMGYESHSNQEARRMIARRYGRRIETGIIALLYSVVGGESWLENPFDRAFLNGIEAETGKRSLDLHLTPSRSSEIPRIIRQNGVDGIILQCAANNLQELAEFRLPIMVLGGNCGSVVRSTVPDNTTGTYLATKHLIELGHRRIAYVGMYSRFSVGSQRYKGYGQAITEHQLPLCEEWRVEARDTTFQAGHEAMTQLMKRQESDSTAHPEFTAVVCYNDVLAMGVTSKAQEAGLRVPQELSVVGFDDLSTEYHFQPALTSVAFDRHTMGRRAVSWICEESQRLLHAGQEAQPETGIEVFPVSLSVRDSTCPPSA
jgi:DNA-binding LacI/PurR family transcriptional regulator